MNLRLFEALVVENLECRTLLAGNVTAVVRGDDLVVEGDTADNSIVIRATAQADRYVVDGLQGTTINGAASVTLTGIEDDFRINLRNGNNELMLTAAGPDGEQPFFVVSDQLRVRTGSGDDLIVFDKVQVLGSSQIKTGRGNDCIVTSATILVGTTRIHMGAGEDVLGVDSSSVEGQLHATLGRGNDRYVLFDSAVKQRSSISLGQGDDMAGFSGSNTRESSHLRGGGQFDQLLIANANFADLRLHSMEQSRSANATEVGNVVSGLASVNRAFDLIIDEGTAF